MKIDIIGSVASGKTTLAKTLSKIYNVPYYEKDNIVWERTSTGDKKRTDEERDKIFYNIIKSDDWIVEGSPRKNLRESFEECEYIILLNVKTHIRFYRVLKRWILQRKGRLAYNSKPTVKFLLYNFKWVFEYDLTRKQLMSTLALYGDKCKVFDNSTAALKFIDSKYDDLSLSFRFLLYLL